MGWINNPKKAAYNKVYNKTSIGLFDLIRSYLSRNPGFIPPVQEKSSFYYIVGIYNKLNSIILK